MRWKDHSGLSRRWQFSLQGQGLCLQRKSAPMEPLLSIRLENLQGFDRTLGLDPEHLESLMDDTVRAVVPIHYAGVACDLDGIREVLARWPRAELVEDHAHGLCG